MLAEATWLEIGFLWFQRFKRYGDQWQKGNASMQMHGLSKTRIPCGIIVGYRLHNALFILCPRPILYAFVIQECRVPTQRDLSTTSIISCFLLVAERIRPALHDSAFFWYFFINAIVVSVPD